MSLAWVGKRKIKKYIPNSSIVLYHDGLHSLDQTSLNVSSFGGFYSSINQTLTTTYVKKKYFASFSESVLANNEYLCFENLISQYININRALLALK